ncbi:MAG: hypothetical protein WCB04_08805 [Mycobacteriales bacterium]
MSGGGGRRLLLAAAGATAARAALAGARKLPAAGRFERRNHRGRPVSLLAGPVLAGVAAATAYAAAPRSRLGRSALLVALAGGALGAYDDRAGARPDQITDKGIGGHLRAVREGRVSAGLVKVAGLGAAGLLAGGSVATGPLDRLVAGCVIAGSANLVNLFDLRPGRALKVGLMLGVPLMGGPAGAVLAGPVGAAAGLLPDDLRERTMLGDTGANALGAIVGLGLAASASRVGRVALLGALVAATLCSERISFTAVIERTPLLRELDALGRLPAPVE